MKEETKKLFKVNLRGLTTGTGIKYGESYVIARDCQKAYDMIKRFLETEGIGFAKDRELESVELLAEDDKYNDCGHILFIED